MSRAGGTRGLGFQTTAALDPRCGRTLLSPPPPLGEEQRPTVVRLRPTLRFERLSAGGETWWWKEERVSGGAQGLPGMAGSLT
ncbi:hypothetical protein GN956_G6407 [Arapaima gigas]